MKKIFIVLLIISLAGIVGCSDRGKSDNSSRQFATSKTIDTPDKKASYAMGYNMGKNLKQIHANLDQDSLIQGVIDAVNRNEPLMTVEEIKTKLSELQKNMGKQRKAQQKELAAKRKELAERNKVQGEQFLKENAKKPGVIVTESGLQYRIIKKGSGPNPTATDKVKVHYRGTIIDGTKFDSSYKRGSPATFLVSGVIKGWTEALQLMKVGSKYQLFIPSMLAYKQRGAGPNIGPNATLIFEIELLEILSPDKAKGRKKAAK